MSNSKRGRREHKLIGVDHTGNNELQQGSPKINTSAPKTDQAIY